jgi:epoxyqueuosine reductase
LDNVIERNTRQSLSEQVLDFARSWGAAVVGVASRETLAGGPPSGDLEFILPGARSAVSIAVPLNKDCIRSSLAKEDRRSHEQDNFRVTMEATGIAAYLARYLEQEGYPSKGVTSNDAYREEMPGGCRSILPDLFHRYLAVRSGLGWFGFSGNRITPQ